MTRSEWIQPVLIGGRKVSYGLALLLGAAIYLALARLGLSFAHLQESASPIWPASGFAVAGLVIAGPRLFPAILLGAFVANSLVGGPVTALPIALGNTLEALAGYWLIRRLGALNVDFFPLTRTASIASAALVATPLSALAGVATLAAAGALGSAQVEQVAFTWWTGDMLGILLLTPLLLQINEALARRQAWDGQQVVTAILCILAAPALTSPAFDRVGFDPAIFLALAAMIGALRWGGPIAASLSILATAGFWILATSAGSGPFAANDANAALLNMQIMLAAFAIATMILAEKQRVGSPIPIIAFLTGILLTAAVFFGIRYNQQQIDERHLINVSARIQGHIQERIGTYANALQGGASLYAASRYVNKLEWRRYVESLDMQRRYPGIRGLGVVLPADKSSATAFVYAMRKDNTPDFTIKPIPDVLPEDTPFMQHFVVVYIEPVAGNEAAIGLDLASEPRRRAAALMSRETGNPAITSRITLVQDDRHEAGFLLFVPMYREPTGSSTPEMLRWYFHGWIYVPFTARDFFASAMIAESAEVRLRIYDGAHADPAELVYDSAGDAAAVFRASHRSQMLLFGHDFTVEWQETAAFARQDPLLPIALSAAFVLLSGLLAAFIATLLSQKDRAIHFADRMSAELALANERFELAVDCSQDVIWDHDITTGRTWASPRLHAMFGYRSDEIGTDYWRFWESVILPEDFTPFYTHYDDILAGRRDAMDMVLRYRHRDGHVMHVQTRAQSVRDGKGNVVRVIGVDTDITLVKQLEHRLRGAINVMVDGFGLFDADDRVILYNDAFIDDGTRKVIGDPTGCTFEEILRAFAYHDMPVPAPDFDREAWIAARLERHRNPPADPIEVVWGDGRIMRISERRTQDGGYVGIWTDVTETKRLGQRLQDAISAMADGFALFDAEDRLVVTNDAFVTPNVRAYFNEQFIGKTFEELYRAYGQVDLGYEQGPVLEEWLANRLALHRDPPLEPVEISTADGRVLRVMERRTTEGGTVGIWTNITTLRRVEQRLQDAIDSINEGFLLMDAEGRYAVFNSQLLKLYPKTAPFVEVGADFATALRRGAEAGEYPELDTPEKIDAFVKEWSERFRDPTPFQGAAPLAGGGWVLVSHRPTSDGGCVNVYTDITALKERETDLADANLQLQRQAQALTVLAEELRAANIAAHEASLSKSQFLANMSHELRTPLNGILGFADIMRAELFGKVEPPRYREYIEDIHKSGEHLLNLINDILDLSKIEAGKMSLHVEAVSAPEIAQHALRLVTPLANERQVTLLPPEIDSCPILHADERQLKQILLNLLSNAVKFTQAGGTVALGIRDDGGEGAVLVVKDTGIGMTRQEIKTAMERFGQADSAYGKATPGTGLGLPLVEGLVKLHGGSLAIDSEKGKGTIVTVRLPWDPSLPRRPLALTR
jgi:PAS domain S-box-containing protein